MFDQRRARPAVNLLEQPLRKPRPGFVPRAKKPERPWWRSERLGRVDGYTYAANGRTADYLKTVSKNGDLLFYIADSITTDGNQAVNEFGEPPAINEPTDGPQSRAFFHAQRPKEIPMAISSIALCSRALLKLGADTITSFDEGTAEAEVAANLYPSIRDALLSAHPWSFATGQVTLAALAAQPLADFDHACQLPADFLRALSAGADGRGRGLDYRIHERRLYTNVEPVVLTYIFRPDETAFPPFFDQMVIARLAAEFCIPLTESTSRAESLHRLAEKEFARAKSIDSQQDRPERFEGFSLADVRG